MGGTRDSDEGRVRQIESRSIRLVDMTSRRGRHGGIYHILACEVTATVVTEREPMNIVFHRDESFRYDVDNGRVNHEVPS